MKYPSGRGTKCSAKKYLQKGVFSLIKGTATVKKPIKYLGDSKFEITLTDLTANDVNDLLATNGSRIAYQFNAAMEYGGEIREEPESGRLYDVVGGVVENVRSVETDEEYLPDEEDTDGPDCSTCGHLIDWPDENNPDTTVKKCELGLEEDTCDKYEPIIDIGAEDGELGEVEEESCEKCALKAESLCMYPDRGEPCEYYKPTEEAREEAQKETDA